MRDILIRQASKEDIPAVSKLFRDAIRAINSKDYNDKQIKTWSSVYTNNEKWLKKISTQYFIIAELEGITAGFASLEDDGYVDYMYVHKNFQSRGVATALLKEIEQRAGQKEIKGIYSNVSTTARPFFEKYGFKTVRKQVKNIKDVGFVNYRMKKDLLPDVTAYTLSLLTPSP